MITLREADQLPFVSRIRESLRTHRRVMGVAPCGFGKAVCIGFMAQRASARGLRVVVTVHRKELVDQLSNTLRLFNVAHGIICAGYTPDPRQLVQVASVFTLARRMERYREPALLLVDEGHHCVSGTSWGNVVESWPSTRVVAFSASPIRLSGEPLDLFEDLIEGPSCADLIAAGNLSRYRLFAPSTIDVSALHSRGGDYVRGEAEELMTRKTITGSAVEHYRKLCNGEPAIAFCVSVKATQLLAEEFRSVGFRAASIDGSMDDAERRRIMRDFALGQLNVVTSADLLSEGLDIGGIHAAILMRPTQSLGLYIQQVGRALRTAPGKTMATILDHVGNAMRHGLPDAEREWSLQGRAKKKAGTTETPIRQCPACYATLAAASAKCPCGYIFEAQPREVEQVDGELAEVDILAQRRERITQQTAAKTLDELIEVGRRRGYSTPERWAAYVFSARMAKQSRRTA